MHSSTTSSSPTRHRRHPSGAGSTATPTARAGERALRGVRRALTARAAARRRGHRGAGALRATASPPERPGWPACSGSRPSAPAVIHAAGASLDVLSATFAAAVGRGAARRRRPRLLGLRLGADPLAVAVGAVRPGGRGARSRCCSSSSSSGPFVPPAVRLVDRAPDAAAVRRGGGHGAGRRVPAERRRRARAALGDLRARVRRGRDPRLRLALPRPPARRRDGGDRAR